MDTLRDTLSDKPAIETIDGRPARKVSPQRTHALVQSNALIILRRCAGSRGQVATEWDFRLGVADGTNTLLVPDLAYVAIERLRALSRADREQPPFAPDIAVEVRSRSYREQFFREKARKYLATGAALVLDVDPAKRLVTAYTIAGKTQYANGARFRHDAVTWLDFEVDELFADIDLPNG